MCNLNRFVTFTYTSATDIKIEFNSTPISRTFAVIQVIFRIIRTFLLCEVLWSCVWCSLHIILSLPLSLPPSLWLMEHHISSLYHLIYICHLQESVVHSVHKPFNPRKKVSYDALEHYQELATRASAPVDNQEKDFYKILTRLDDVMASTSILSPPFTHSLQHSPQRQP